MRTFYTTVALVTMTFAIASPTSAAQTMSCSAADMAKVNDMMPAMVDGPNKTTMNKEMTAANAAMSKGDMKGCAMHLNMAAKAGMTKQ
jgi:hypothetical protein